MQLPERADPQRSWLMTASSVFRKAMRWLRCAPGGIRWARSATDAQRRYAAPGEILTTDSEPLIDQLPNRLGNLVKRLVVLGYQFERPDTVLPGPSPDVEEKIAYLTSLVGPLPATLAQFYRTVGSIDLCGSHPSWTGCEYPDPLVVEPVEDAIDEAEQYAELTDPKEEYWASESGVFRAPIAPDAVHKAGFSGGMWYGVEIPNALADPLVLEEPHELPFTQYLEFCLSHGGFAGLSDSPGQNWPVDDLRRAAGAA